MPLVQYVVTALQCQVEDFPATVADGDKQRDFDRSCEGALHLRPGSSVEMTADELAHIREKHPKAASCIRVLVDDEQLKASRSAPTLPPAAPTPDDDGDPVVKKSGKR
jgi:hypothetical protein